MRVTVQVADQGKMAEAMYLRALQGYENAMRPDHLRRRVIARNLNYEPRLRGWTPRGTGTKEQVVFGYIAEIHLRMPGLDTYPFEVYAKSNTASTLSPCYSSIHPGC